MNCTFDEMLRNDPYTLEAIRQTIKPFYSWYLDIRFLKEFYTQQCAYDRQPVQTHIYNCYQSLLNFWLDKREQRAIDEQQVATIALQLDKLKQEGNWYDDLILIAGLFAFGYLIYTIKK